jgi:O-antigen biosynthesis protein
MPGTLDCCRVASFQKSRKEAGMEQHRGTVLIIAGMHRSGTSVTASVLQSAGLDIGQELIGAAPDNPRGFFEDADFVKFHETVLASQGLSHLGERPGIAVQVQEQFVGQARSLVEARRAKPLWGWKDPRNTLFLDFWAKLVPEAKFVFVYRNPWDVVDSLYRRGHLFFRTNPGLAVNEWLNCNRAILQFYERFPQRSILFHVPVALQDPRALIEAINRKFATPLRPPARLFEKELLQQQSWSQRPLLLHQYYPEAIALYRELHARADIKDDTDVSAPPAQDNSAYKAWALQDWADVRILQFESAQLRARIAKMESSIFWKIRKGCAWLKRVLLQKRVMPLA